MKRVLSLETIIETVPNTTKIKRYRGRVVKSSLERVRTKNYESQANQALDHTGYIVTVEEFQRIYKFAMKTTEYHICKDGRPSFKDMNIYQRTSIISIIRRLGNISSRYIHRMTAELGLNAHQIGQIRRWHKSDWEVSRVKV